MQDIITFTEVAEIICNNEDLACNFCKYCNGAKCIFDFNKTKLDCEIGVENWLRKEYQKFVGEDY